MLFISFVNIALWFLQDEFRFSCFDYHRNEDLLVLGIICQFLMTAEIEMGFPDTSSGLNSISSLHRKATGLKIYSSVVYYRWQKQDKKKVVSSGPVDGTLIESLCLFLPFPVTLKVCHRHPAGSPVHSHFISMISLRESLLRLPRKEGGQRDCEWSKIWMEDSNIYF